MLDTILALILAYWPTIADAAAVGFLALCAWAVRQYVGHDLAREALLRLSAAAAAAVGEVAQSYVDDLKAASADGTLTGEEKAEARARALARLRELLGPKGLAILVRAIGSDGPALQAWLVASVEAAVAALKASRA